MNKYEYLFPFEKVPAGSRVLIYGAGDVGIEYLKQLKVTGYAECVGFVDRAKKNIPPMLVPVYLPEEIGNICFDYIVLAFKTDTSVQLVCSIIEKQGICRDRIILPCRRKAIAVLAEKNPVAFGRETLTELAATKRGFSIALKYGPGIGDAVIKKSLFINLLKLFPAAKIDIYSPCPAEIIMSIYRDRRELGNIIEDSGVLFQKYKTEYTISLQAFFVLQLEYINFDQIKKHYPESADNALRLQQGCREYDLSIFPHTQSGIHFRRMMYQRKKCFSFYDYTGIIKNELKKVYIPVSTELAELEQIVPGKYITINYGNGISQNDEFMPAKQWPYDYYERLIRLFKTEYSEIKVIQIGAEDNRRLENADKHILGQNFEIVKQLLSNAQLHFDIEGGLMHLASNIGTKCVVIYGPTQKEIFSYDDNINIVSEKCHGCYGLSNELYKCIKGMKQPECMYSVTPEMVMERVKEYIGAL